MRPILAQGLVVRAHGGAVSIGNHSAILENGVVIGTPGHPVRVGQRTVFGHRATIVGATIGDLCEIGNGAILMPGSRLGDGCILGEGTLVPPDTVIPAGSVLVGRPPHVIRSATDTDRERLAVLRQHQTNLTDYPGTIVHGPMRAGERMGTLYAYRDKTPSIGAGTVLFDSAEITGDVVIGEDSLIGAGVKIIGDSHGPVRVGSRVQILENTGRRSERDAARLMTSGHFRHLPVTGDAGLVGIIDITDVCRALLETDVPPLRA